MVLTDEIWKDIPNFEGSYQISDKGQVKSLRRVVTGGGSFPVKNISEKMLKPFLSGDKTMYPTVHVHKDGVKTKLKVHKVLLEIFKGPPPTPEHVARHLNDVPTDFRLENLEWGTQSQNMLDKFKNGYVHHRKILTDELKTKIKNDPRSQREIANELKVSQKTIWRAKNK